MVLPGLIVALSLLIDRVVGDPRTSLHPVAVLGRFIGWWGRPDHYPSRLQRFAGVALWACTVLLFSLPFLLFEQLVPWYILLIGGPFLLKICMAWRSLEDHVRAVTLALEGGLDAGREKVAMMVSRDPSSLNQEQVLSAAYESVSENLVDSVIAPLFYFGVGELFGAGLALAAAYRAANTMDAMLGYRDERTRLGWWPARADDLLGYLPARISGVVLLLYFSVQGRGQAAYRALKSDAHKRPGVNGGIPLALIAGGTGVVFEKPGVYRMGQPGITLDYGGGRVIWAVRATVLIFSAILIAALCLLRPFTNM
ncbi:MAG: adenosylcobinamide-phosphate synthase CbiB [Methanomicrobiales archaeon]|nr:adenosylcobinamide-phosphate synthase CbiB [Methanomicrobiales archaeon]